MTERSNDGSLPRPTFAPVSAEQWRERVDQELRGADFDATLRTRVLGGLTLEPVYREAVEAEGLGGAPYGRGGSASPRDWSFGASWLVQSRFEGAGLATENEGRSCAWPLTSALTAWKRDGVKSRCMTSPCSGVKKFHKPL